MNRPYNTYQNNYEADIPFSYDIVFATPSPTPTQTPNHNHNHYRFESPVRDHNHKAFQLKTEEKFKDHYDVSNFKFHDVATTKSRTNHANYCELAFDGTKSTKHHHRKKNTIKRVNSTTTINCCPKKEQIKEREIEQEHVHFQQCEKEERNKDNTFHYLAEQFKNKLNFIEVPVKLHKQVICNPEERNRFEVILSPKTPASFSSLETMSNLLKSSEHRPKKIILTSNRMSRPHMRDREIQTAIIGIRNFHNMDECYNMRLTSVNDIFYNMNRRSSNEEDTFNFRQKKNDKNNLTITHFPCLEIKCSSIFFEMPANSVRTPMPRRTLDTSNVIIDDYNEACAAVEANKGSETTVTVANSERTDPLKDKIFSLLNGTQISLGADYNQKVNDLCDLIGSLISENANKHNKNQKMTAKRAADMYINIKKVKANNLSSKRKSVISVSPSQKKYVASSGSEKSSHSILANGQNRSRSVSPPSRPSTPSCQINKVTAGDTSPRGEPNKFYAKTIVNLSTAEVANKKFSSMSIPSISTISNESHRFKMVYKTSDDDILTKEREEFASPVPRDVFIIPPHVNKLLKNNNTKKENRAKSANNANTADFHLVNILKKPPTKQSWVVPDFPSKFQPKCDVVNHFQCMPSTKSKKGEHDCIGPSVTFSSMVDIIGGENDDSLEEPIYPTNQPINTLVPVISLPKQTKTVQNKIEPPAMDDDGESFQNTCNVPTFPGRPFEKPKAYEKQASFYNSSFFSLKKDITAPTSSCLQKRKEYDSKLKRQMQNKQPSKMPLQKSNTEQDTESQNTAKSKLPVKIPDEVTSNKPSFMKNQNQNQIPETSKLFTTDIKNTPFIQLRTESLLKKTDIPQMSTPRSAKNPRIHMNIQNMQTSLNVNKDVSRAENETKEIIFIKHPEVDFHKPHIKFKMHHHWPPKTIEIPKNIVTCNTITTTTNTNNNNINKNMNMNLYVNKNLTENTIKTPKFTKEYLTTQSENTKRQTTNNPQKLIFIFRNKEEPKSEGVIKKDPPADYTTEYETFKRNKKKGNRVMFIEPVELESLCKIQESQICYPAASAKKPPPKKPKPPPKSVLTKKVRPKRIFKTIKKSKTKIKVPAKKVSSKAGKKKSQSGMIAFCDTMCCGCCGLCAKLRKRGREKAKAKITNLITCCTTLCSNIHLKNMIFRKQQPPSMLHEQSSVQSSTHQVKSIVDKVYSTNSFKNPTIYFVATTKGVLTTQKKQNPAWKFKDLLYKKMCQPYSPSKIPNALYNTIKYIQKDAINKMFPRFNIKEQENTIKIGAVISNHSSTDKISDLMKEYPNSLKKFKVINKGRFTRNTTSTGRKTTSSFRDVIDTVYVPRSPRKVIPCAQPVSISPKIFNKSEPSYLLFPIKEEITLKQKRKLNIPTFQFPWIKNIPYEPKTVEDLKLNTSRFSKKIDDRQVDIQQSPNIKKTLPKSIEDKPIITLSNMTQNPSLPKKTVKNDKRPVIFDSETRKIYENRPKTPSPHRELTTATNKKEKVTKLPAFKKNMDNTISEENINKPLLKRQNALRRRKISKLVLETNELVHIPDEDCFSVNSKDSKVTEYQSVVHYSGLSSNSQLSIASSSKGIPTISRTLVNIVGNFFRKYSKKIKSKKKKLMKDNG